MAEESPQIIGLPPGASEETAGEDAKKYGTSNPLVRRLLDRLLRRLRLATSGCSGTFVDVGVGEGLALEALDLHAEMLIGVEYRADKLTEAVARVPRLNGVQADAGLLPFRDRSVDLVTCIEVLEHLTAPERAVAELARICAGRTVVSVPWEPFFRLGNLARGKDIARIGNNPEHIGQFTPRKLRSLLGASFTTVEVRRCFPWLVAVATDPRV